MQGAPEGLAVESGGSVEIPIGNVGHVVDQDDNARSPRLTRGRRAKVEFVGARDRLPAECVVQRAFKGNENGGEPGTMLNLVTGFTDQIFDFLAGGNRHQGNPLKVLGAVGDRKMMRPTAL